MPTVISGIGFDPETKTLNVLFTGELMEDVNTLYTIGNAEDIKRAVACLADCAGVLSAHASAGNKAVLLSKCSGVSEGQECLISTKRWERKRGKLVLADGNKLNFVFCFLRDDGTYGPEITRSADIVTIEPYVPEAEG